MTDRLTYLALAIGSTLFIRCGKGPSTEPPSDIQRGSGAHLLMLDPTNPHNIVGEWVNSFPFYSSQLILNSNGSYSLQSRGCTGQDYVEGSWSQAGTTVVLSSVGRRHSYTESIDKSGNNEPSSDTVADKANLNGIALSSFPEYADQSFATSEEMEHFLEERSLLLAGDTLFVMDDHGAKTDTKYIRSIEKL